MSCVCTQELPDKNSDNCFSFSQPCAAQTTVIVSRCECQEDKIRQMEVRRTHRKGRMIPLKARGSEEQEGQIDLHGLGSKRPGLDGDELYGLWSPATW